MKTLTLSGFHYGSKLTVQKNSNMGGALRLHIEEGQGYPEAIQLNDADLLRLIRFLLAE